MTDDEGVISTQLCTRFYALRGNVHDLPDEDNLFIHFLTLVLSIYFALIFQPIPQTPDNSPRRQALFGFASCGSIAPWWYESQFERRA